MKKHAKQNKHKGASESQGTSFKSSLGGTMSFGFKHMLLALLVGLVLGRNSCPRLCLCMSHTLLSGSNTLTQLCFTLLLLLCYTQFQM